MNNTQENETGGFSTMEYVLLSLTIVEQILSFTGQDQPKSIIQVIMSVFYQIYRFCCHDVNPTSVETSKTVSSHFSVNVGSFILTATHAH